MAAEVAPRRPTGLLVDFGGVLTSDVFDAFEAFCRGAGLAPAAVRDTFRDDPDARALLAALETGELAEADFERRFAASLGVGPDRLIERLFARMAPAPAMLDAVRAARRGGVRTGLLSNSWTAGHYDRAVLDELFDAVVISGEVGLRKPDTAIYELAARRLGVPAARLVFVDDLPGNLKPARALGMTTVRHRSAAETIGTLEGLLGVGLRSA